MKVSCSSKIQNLQTKELEPHFVIGEALVMCASGYASNKALNKWTDDDECINEDPRNTDQGSLNDNLLQLFLFFFLFL